MVALVAAALAFVQASSVPAAADVRARLAAYEQRLARTQSPDPAELGDIARVVIEQARRSPKFAVWTEACASTVVPDSDTCGPRLWAVLNRQTETRAARAEAASALVARGDAAAADALADALKGTPASALAPLAPILAELPAKRAVPLLVRLSQSSSPADQGLACRYLGGFDQAESRDAIRAIVAANPPGTEPWLLCMIAQAQLHETNTPGAVLGYAHSLPPSGLLYAGSVMLQLGDGSAVQVLTDLTHRGTMSERLQAAALLADRAPDVAAVVVDQALAASDAALRADALSVERRLKRDPSVVVRGMLVDATEIVRIRAAEDIRDWVGRQKR